LSGRSSGSGRGSFRHVEQIVPLLAPDETLIEYFVTEDRILAVVLGKQRHFLRTLDLSPAGLRDKLDHLRLQLESLAATADRPLGGEAFLRRGAEARLRGIYDVLLRPLLHEVPPGGRLTILPHDILHQVPFECLHDGAQYVDRSWRVTRCPTAT
jgi:hypothetical protein